MALSGGGIITTSLPGVNNGPSLPARCIFTPVAQNQQNLTPAEAAQLQNENIQYDAIVQRDETEGKKPPSFDSVMLSDQAQQAQQCTAQHPAGGDGQGETHTPAPTHKAAPHKPATESWKQALGN